MQPGAKKQEIWERVEQLLRLTITTIDSIANEPRLPE